jgi:hypothetical protein
MARDDARRARNNQIPALSLSLKFLIYLVGTGHFLKPEEQSRRQVKKSESFILTK